MIGRENEVKEYRIKASRVVYVLGFFFLLLVGRLYYLQIGVGDQLRKFSEANRLKKEVVHAARGVIYDREGRVIVDNRASFDVVLVAQYYPFTKESNLRLSKVLDIPLPELEEKLAKARKAPKFFSTLIKSDVSKDTIAGIEMDANGFPGINIEATVTRRYPYGEMAAQTLGYVGEVNPSEIEKYSRRDLKPGDYLGKTGLEKVYDAFLRGENGVGYVEVDATGRRRTSEKGQELLGFVTYVDPIAGNDLYLTLDIDLQVAAVEAMKELKANGSVVAIDPRSGEVLAMVSLPSYLPSSISGREVSPAVWKKLSEDIERPLRNRAIQDHYPPGSTFKLVSAIAGLNEKILTPKTAVHCIGSMRFGNRRPACWNATGHGATDFYKGIRESCNIFFYQAGIQLGVDRIAKYARMFGLGDKTGIRLPSETTGLVPDSEWKLKTLKEPWQPGEDLSVAIGQGFVSVTPIQLASFYSAIGNEGFLYRPYLVNRIESKEGDTLKQFRPELVRRIDLPKDVFVPVKEALYQVVNQAHGTAYWRARSDLVVISGKTGTSQVRGFRDIASVKCENLPLLQRQHGWFVGYAPRDNPEIAVAVIGEHVCHSSASAPVAKKVIEAYFQKKKAQS